MHNSIKTSKTDQSKFEKYNFQAEIAGSCILLPVFLHYIF